MDHISPLKLKLAEHADAPQLASSFEATIHKFDRNFSAYLLDLLARLSVYSTSDCEQGMASVVSRLDLNGFYTERLERVSAERSRTAAPQAPGPRGPPGTSAQGGGGRTVRPSGPCTRLD